MKPTLIIVEDVPSVRDELKALLHEEFEVVAEAGDGRAALRDIIRLSPDLVLLDVVMPIESGLELVRKVRMLPTRKPAMVALSGLADEKVQSELLALGVYDYLLKPADGSVLTRVLRDAATKSQTETEI